MPYVSPTSREGVPVPYVAEDGELAYLIAKAADEFLYVLAGRNSGQIRFEHIARVLGIIEAAKMEVYRQVAVPYEDRKLAEHGTVFGNVEVEQ